MSRHRVTVRARFANLSRAAREHLAAEAGHHGVLAARYSPEGTVTYGPDLRGLVFRQEVDVDATEATEATEAAERESRARASAEQALRAWAAQREGVEVSVSRADVTCLDDIRIRRPRRGTNGSHRAS